jgi:type III secretion system (T3SS) SseB-like protein
MADDYLAQCLEWAAANPARKPEFVKALRAATIFVMGEVEGEDPAARSQPALGSGNVILRCQITPDGRQVVPFFSSIEKLQGFVPQGEQITYLSIPAMMLFELANGATVVLNPGSRVSGEISPEDVAKLMAQGGA